LAREKVLELVKRVTLPVVQEAGLELVDVEYAKEGGRYYLRIFIDKPGGVRIEDCQHVSEKIDRLLDELDPIPQSYFLEVSSPGIDRPLKKAGDYIRFAGRLARVKTFSPVEGRRKFTGRIVGMHGEDVVMQVEGKEMSIPFKQIASARLEVEF